MTIIKSRRGTAAQWTAANTVLAEGEQGFEIDTGRFKYGDGVKTWSQLEYFNPGTNSTKVDTPIVNRAMPAFQTGNGLSDGVIRGGTSVVRHKIIRSAGGVRLVFTNHYPEANAIETDGPNPITVRAAVEVVQGSDRIPVSVQGSREFVVPAGGYVVSDFIGLDLKAGEFMWSWTYVSVAAGQKFPRGGYAGVNSSEGFNYGDPAVDVTLSGTRPSVRDAYAYGPAMVLGSGAEPSKVVVGLVGDSITAGSQDGQVGWLERALQGKLPFHKAAYPSESMHNWTLGNIKWHYRRLALFSLGGVNRIIAAHGRNDMSVGLAAVQTRAISYWLGLSHYGRVWATTVTPYTTSTDAWATVANQTVQNAGHETTRVDYNTWLRDGAPIDGTTRAALAVGAVGLRAGQVGHPLVGYFDVTDAAESARNSGKWKPNYVSDGIHPNPTGSIALGTDMASTIQNALS